jgi:flagellar hook-length control protein FliK
MAQLNVLPVDVTQPTDSNVESQLMTSKNQKGDGNFSKIIDGYIASDISGNAADNANNGGNKLSKKESQQADSLEKHINTLNVDNEALDITSTEIEKMTGADDAALVNEEAKAVGDLSQLEQSQHFISLVNSASKILQTSQGDKPSSNIEERATSEPQVTVDVDLSQLEQSQHSVLSVNSSNKILQTSQSDKPVSHIEGLATSQPQVTADEIVNERQINLSQSSAVPNDALALKISQTIKNTQLNVSLTEKEKLDASNKLATVDANTEQEIDNVTLDDKSLLNDKFVGQTVLSTVLATSSQTDVALKDASQTSGSPKGNIDSSVQGSITLNNASLKNTEVKSANQEVFVNQQTEVKAHLAEKNVADSQAKDALSKELQYEKNVLMPNTVDENSDVIETKKAGVNPNVSLAPSNSQLTDISSQVTRSQEIGPSEVTIEDISHAVMNERVSQVKNNAVVLNETISIVRKDFTEAVKDKILVIISQKLQQFDIRLDPPELGSVHVRVNLQHEQAVINFVVQNQQAKEAFEENLGKLKDMLSQNGVDVGDANVEQQGQQSEDDETNTPSNDSESGVDEHEPGANETVLLAELFKTPSSAVDYYA